jgi:hypothetical protein
MYKFKAVFAKTFTRGHLKGLVYPGSIPFTSPESIRKWEAGVRKNIARGALDYALGEVTIEAI